MIKGTITTAMVSRRTFIELSMMALIAQRRATEPEDLALEQRFLRSLRELQRDPKLSGATRRSISQDESLRQPEASRLRGPKSKTPIGTRASGLIVACEVTSPQVYRNRYRVPAWPGGASGITIGIGYDLGYVTVNNFDEDWGEYIDQATRSLLSSACGQQGTVAAAFHKRLTTSPAIEWDVAQRQFELETLPRAVGETETALPNTKSLSEDSLGALVSLVYNRGPSFNDPDERYREMRDIKAAMTARTFGRIPDLIRSMKRLWKDKADMRGLLLRRDAEADLFEIGLRVR